MSRKLRETSLVNAYALQIENIFARLNRPFLSADAENLAFFLLRAMGSEARDYHRPEHALEVAKHLSPVGQLAALFHDLVYVQVDPTWTLALEQDLHPFIPDVNFGVDIREKYEGLQDPWLKVVVQLFGFEECALLTPSQGLNEFLSAIVFYRKLKNFLVPEELLRGLACIEATIPFRKADANGRGPAQQLVERIERILKGKGHLLFPTPVQSSRIVKECTLMVENDLSSFGVESVGEFLSNTWNVMIENYPALRNEFFTLSEYRSALYGNIRFLSTLDARTLYWTDLTSVDLNHEKLIRRTALNLTLGEEYLKAIAITVALLEAFALQTGGEGAFQLFWGPFKRSREHALVNMDKLLQGTTDPHLSGERMNVYGILKLGRKNRSRFDAKTSALSAWLYARLTSEKFTFIFEQFKQFHAGKISADEYLLCFDLHCLVDVITLLEQTALTRKRVLADLKQIFVRYAKNAS